MPLFHGFLFGLATMFLIGPVFFTLLKASLGHGIMGGVWVAIGIIVSDMIVSVLCLSIPFKTLQDHIPTAWLSLIGAAVLAVVGVHYLMHPPIGPDKGVKLRGRGAIALFASGFVINGVNPFVFAIWIAFVLHATTSYGPGGSVSVFVAGALIGIFVTDIVKAVFAPKLRSMLSSRVLKKVHMVIGVIMLLFSLRLVIRAIMA